MHHYSRPIYDVLYFEYYKYILTVLCCLHFWNTYRGRPIYDIFCFEYDMHNLTIFCC